MLMTLLVLVSVQYAQAADWWNGTWSQRIEVSIANLDPINDYINLPINSTAINDVGITITHSGGMIDEVDCSDIRVVCNNVLVPFGISDCSDTIATLVWKYNISALSTTNCSIYFGANVTATNISWYSARYNVYDDFVNGTYAKTGQYRISGGADNASSVREIVNETLALRGPFRNFAFYEGYNLSTDPFKYAAWTYYLDWRCYADLHIGGIGIVSNLGDATVQTMTGMVSHWFRNKNIAARQATREWSNSTATAYSIDWGQNVATYDTTITAYGGYDNGGDFEVIFWTNETGVGFLNSTKSNILNTSADYGTESYRLLYNHTFFGFVGWDDGITKTCGGDGLFVDNLTMWKIPQNSTTITFGIGEINTNSITNVSILPVSPLASNMLYCNVTSIANGATIYATWRWYNGSTLYSNGTYVLTNNTAAIVANLSGGIAATGETWKCGVKITIDNASYSSETFASILIKGVLFDSSIPANIDIFNILPIIYYNTTYTYHATLGYANNTVILYAKTNTSATDISYYYNGTAVTGYYQVGWAQNNSGDYTFRLSENGVYRGTYNKVTDSNTIHETVTFGANTQRIAQQLLNISLNTPYNVLEFMINSSTGATSSLVIRYCNQSFSITNGVDAIGNSNCGICGTMGATTGYGHTHSTYSAHNNITIPINITSGFVCGVKGTSNGTFVFSSSAPSSWNAHYTTGAIRTRSWGYTGNRGTTWAVDDATLDMHLHQYTNDSTHYEYACYTDSTGAVCSTVRSDLIDMTPLAPISPIVYSPTNTTYNGNVPINWTPAVGVLGTILNYTIYQLPTTTMDGLLLDMPFTANSSTVAINVADPAANGTVSGAVWTSSGRYGGAYTFNTTTYINASDINMPLYNYTISSWIYRTGAGGYTETLYGTSVVNTVGMFGLLGSSSSMWYRYYDTSNTARTASAASVVVSNNVWTHVLATLSANGTHTTVTFYKNGASVYSTILPGIFNKTISKTVIGSRYGLDSGFNGTIDEVRIWNRALLASEVSTEYNDKKFNYITNANTLGYETCAKNLTLGSSIFRVEATDNNSLTSFGESETWYNNYVNHTIKLFTPINTTINALVSSNVDLKCNITKSSNTSLGVNFTGNYPSTPATVLSYTQLIGESGTYMQTMNSSVLNYTNITICYQETATTATSCGGLSTGSYWHDTCWASSPHSAGYCYDGSWSTYCKGDNSAGCDADWTSNYTIPANIAAASLKYKSSYSSGAITYSTIPASCLTNRTDLMLLFSLRFHETDLVITCLNSTGGAVIVQDYSSYGSLVNFYEEAVLWNLTTTINILDWQGYANFTCKQDTATCTEGDTISGVWQVYRDTVYPSLSILTPTVDQQFMNNTLPQTISFTYTAIDTAVRDKCWYSLDGNTTVLLPTCANFTLSIPTFGWHYITIGVNDTANNIVEDTTAFQVGYLEVFQKIPTNGVYIPSANVNFTCEVNPVNLPLTIVWFDIYYTSNASLANTTSILTSDSVITNYTITVPLPYNTNYTWRCSANTTDMNYTTRNRTFIVDTILPNITISSPPDYYTATSENRSAVNVNLTFNSTDTNFASWTWTVTSPNSTICVNSTACWGGTISPLDYYGRWYLNITTYDLAGNIARASVNWGFANIDNTLRTKSRAFNSNYTINLSDTFMTASTANCTVISNNTALATCDGGIMNNGSINCTLTALALAGIEQQISQYITCVDGNFVMNTSTWSGWIDTTAPIFLGTNFMDYLVYIVNRNVTGYFNFTDSNLYRINVSIDNRNIFNLTNINATKYDYILNYNTSLLPVGVHRLSIQVADSHTAAEIGTYLIKTPIVKDSNTFVKSTVTEYFKVDEWDVSTPLLSNKLVYRTTSDNEIEIKATDNTLSTSPSFTSEKQRDRYVFTYLPQNSKAAEYNFQVKTTHPIEIVNKPNTPQKMWIVSGNNWIDFYTPELENFIVTITLIDPYTATVRYQKPIIKAGEIEIPIDKGEGEIPETPIVKDEVLDTPALKFSSVGDLNIIQENFIFYTISVAMTYTPTVIESQMQNTQVFINFNGTPTTYFNVSFTWNNVTKTLVTDYNSSNPNQTTITANATFVTPLFDATTVVEGLWRFIYASGTVETPWFNMTGTELLTIGFNQTVLNMGLTTNCSTPNSSKSLTLYSRDEATDKSVPNMTLNINLDLWLDDSTVANNMHFEFRNQSNYTICVYPNTTTYNVYSIMEYTAVGYTDRKYYLVNTTLNATERFVDLNLINSSLGSYIVLEVDNIDYGNPIAGAYIKIERYYPGNNSYNLVEVLQTDNNGKAGAWLAIQDVFYRFIVEYPGGTIRLVTDRQQIYSDTKTFLISLADSGLVNWNRLGTTLTNVECNEGTTTCTFDWNDATNTVQTATLKVYEDSGFARTLIYEGSTSSAAGRLFYTINASNNTRYVAQSGLTIGQTFMPAGEAELYLEDNPFSRDTQSRIGLLLPLILLIISLAAMLLDFGAIGVILGSVIVLVIGILVGLIPLSIVAMISIILLAIVLVFKMRS